MNQWQIFLVGLVAIALLIPTIPYLIAFIAVVLIAVVGILKTGGGPLISILSMADSNDVFEFPEWFGYLKWGTLPIRIIDSIETAYEVIHDYFHNE